MAVGAAVQWVTGNSATVVNPPAGSVLVGVDTTLGPYSKAPGTPAGTDGVVTLFGITVEAVQDIIGSMTVDSSDIDVTYDDVGNTLTFTIKLTAAIWTALNDHINDTVDAHDATAISFAPAGNIAATDVQAAIVEVRNESVQDGDTAGGVLSGTYPSPGFAVDMATQAELDAEAALARNGDNITSGTVADARIAASIARDSEVTAAVAAEAVLARNADNLTSGTVADARIASTIARDSEVTAAVAAEAALARNADNLTSGTVADARIAGTIARDTEVAAAITAAQAAAVTNGDTTHSPTGDAVFDHLTAGYQPLAAPLTQISAFVPANLDFMQYRTSPSAAWYTRTPTQVTADLITATIIAKGLQSSADKIKEDNLGTDVMADLGCVSGVDATAALNAWVTALPAGGGGTLLIPMNFRLRVDGNVPLNKPNIRVIGRDRRSSIVSTGNATNTQFDVTGDACVFQCLRFEAGGASQDLALRTGLTGYAVDIDAVSNGSGMYQTDIIGYVNGYNFEGQIPFLIDCNIREYGALTTGGQCVRVATPNAGGDMVIDRLLTDNGSNITNWAGVRWISGSSLNILNTNVIHATVGLAIEPPNGGTCPSLKVFNSYFDNGTHGVRFNPGGTGVWYRSEFTQCWMGSNSVAGIKCESAQFDGIVFANCDILGNPVGIDMNNGGGRWAAVAGCQIAGSSTAGIRVAPSTNHFPLITNNRICPQLVGGAFGANAVGIIVGAGAYHGLMILGNDVANNTTALTLGAVTIAGGTALDYQRFRIEGNAGINPRGAVTIPGVPAAGAQVINTTGFEVQVIWKVGTANTAILINGVTYTVATVAAAVMSVTLKPGGTFQFTGGTMASWSWIGQ